MRLLSGLLGLVGCNNERAGHTFEQQLATFKNLGFTLNEGVNASLDIIQHLEKNKEFEVQPYHLMYQQLGSTIARKPFTPISDKAWKFDLEAIEDHGDYVKIMSNRSRISNGELFFENLNDFVDIENEKAWVSFTCRGDSYKWDLIVDDDWTDDDLFDKVQELAEKYHTKRRYTFFNTGGQDFVLGYATALELEAMRKVTGLDIVWLKAKQQILLNA
jgi:hypothetical protein